jgi:hypothetical protein
MDFYLTTRMAHNCHSPHGSTTQSKAHPEEERLVQKTNPKSKKNIDSYEK